MTVRPTGVSWRSLPMRDADALEVHPLRDEHGVAVLFARFAPGWSRWSPAVCTAAEEFVVLEGAIEVNGSLLGPGSVAHVPAGAVRATTSSSDGCTAVAWFDGRLRWEHAGVGAEAGAVLTWHPWDGPGGVRWSTPLATWWLRTARSPDQGLPGVDPIDTVDLDGPTWAPLPPGGQSPHPATHRVLWRRAGHR